MVLYPLAQCRGVLELRRVELIGNLLEDIELPVHLQPVAFADIGDPPVVAESAVQAGSAEPLLHRRQGGVLDGELLVEPLDHVVREMPLVVVNQEILPVEVQRPVLIRRVRGYLGPEGHGACGGVPAIEPEGRTCGPDGPQQGPQVRLAVLPVLAEVKVVGVHVIGNQLVHAVAVQVHALGIVLHPGQEDRPALLVQIVVFMGEGPFPVICVVGDAEAVVAQKVAEEGGAVVPARPGEEGPEGRGEGASGYVLDPGVDPAAALEEHQDVVSQDAVRVLQAPQHLRGAIGEGKRLRLLGLIGLQAVQGDGDGGVPAGAVRRFQALAGKDRLPDTVDYLIHQGHALGPALLYLRGPVGAADAILILPVAAQNLHVSGQVIRLQIELVDGTEPAHGVREAGGQGVGHPPVDPQQLAVLQVEMLRRVLRGVDDQLGHNAAVRSAVVFQLLCQSGHGLVHVVEAGRFGGRGFGPGEGDGTHQRRQGHGGEEGPAQIDRVLRHAGDPVLELALPRRHGGGGEKGIRRGFPHGDEGEKRPAIGHPLRLPQPPEGPLVTGQLAVRPGGQGRPPDQGVEPVDRQAHGPEQGPEGVQVPGVGLLMSQDVPEAVRALEGGGGQVNGGAEQPEEAGGGEALLHQIDPAGGALHGIGPPGPAELSPEEKIGEDQPAGHDGTAGVPDRGQKVRQGNLPLIGPNAFRRVSHGILVVKSVGAVRRGGADGHRRSVVRSVKIAAVRPPGCYGVRRNVQGLHPVRRGLRRRQQAEARRREVHRHQQPQQHQPPEGVLGPAGEDLPKQPPEGQQRQDQRRGGQQDFLHVSSPPALSRMADSSAMSDSDSRRLSTMALIISPRLPP